MTAAITDYRISTVGGMELFNFNSATSGVAVGMHPNVENQACMVINEVQDFRDAGISSAYYCGLSSRSFVLQGTLIDDTTNNNQWRLSSLVHSREVVKVWDASQWFIYALGKQCTFVRNDRVNNAWDFTAAFECYDPFWYYANTGGSATGPYEVDPGYADASTGTITVDLSAQSALNKTYIEPIFIIQGGSTSNVTTAQNITFTDKYGRKATVSPPVALASGVDFMIAPNYFRETPTGFNPQQAACYRIVDGAIVPGTSWGLDVNCYDNTKFTHASNDLVREFCTLDVADTSATNIKPRHSYNYPRLYFNESSTITVASSGTIGNAIVSAQYLYRRL